MWTRKLSASDEYSMNRSILDRSPADDKVYTLAAGHFSYLHDLFNTTKNILAKVYTFLQDIFIHSSMEHYVHISSIWKEQ